MRIDSKVCFAGDDVATDRVIGDPNFEVNR